MEDVLIVAVESLSKDLDWKDRDTCILFGDGAASFVVKKNEIPKTGIRSCSMISRGELSDLITLQTRPRITEQGEKRDYIHINGGEVFKYAVRDMADLLKVAVDILGLRLSDLDYIGAHNANIKIIDGVRKRLGMPAEEIGRKILVNIQKYANTSAASIPLAIDERKEEVLKPGNLIGMVSWGASAKGSAIIYRHPG